MNNLVVKAVLAGIFFGSWPIMMNKSGLSGNVSSAVFAGVALIFVSPFALASLGSVQGVNWTFAIVSGFLAGAGLLFFNGMLAKATPQNFSSLFLIAILSQITVPAVQSMFVTGGLSPSKGAGMLLAVIAAILLIR